MQPAVDKIVAVSLEADAAYRKHILGRHCGIHPENRAKTGVDPFNAQNLTLEADSAERRQARPSTETITTGSVGTPFDWMSPKMAGLRPPAHQSQRV